MPFGRMDVTVFHVGYRHVLATCGDLQDGEIRNTDIFWISNFRRVLYVVCFLLGNSPVSEFYMPTFQNTLSVPSS